jgi:hypothetical protein
MAARAGSDRLSPGLRGGVPAQITDFMGVTNTVLLAIARNAAGRPRVFAVLINETFESD